LLPFTFFVSFNYIRANFFKNYEIEDDGKKKPEEEEGGRS